MIETSDGSTAARPRGSLAPVGRAVPRSRVDFDRPVVSIFGLPFDAIDLAQAVQRIREAAFAGRRCFVSTPNLNFAIAARSDPAFRATVLRSDLNLIDGAPLVWIGRLLGLSIPERVAGSDVFEALQTHDGPPISVYLFGGPPGAAELACESINRRGGAVRCVGFDPAGFGSIESMSSAEQIERINSSEAHFVVASLGAKKGQAWLAHNALRLTAPVLCHLGAVLNFAAGTVRRAPRWTRTLGLEWLWRIREEPGLWRRYWNDGATAARLLVARVFPDWLASRSRPSQAKSAARARLDCLPDGVTVRLQGSWFGADNAALKALLAQSIDVQQPMTIDLSQVQEVDAVFIALIQLAKGWFGGRNGFRIVGASAPLVNTFHRKLAEDLWLPTD